MSIELLSYVTFVMYIKLYAMSRSWYL